MPHCCSCRVVALQMLRVQGQLQAENLRHQMQRDQASGLTTPASSFSALAGEQLALWPHCLHMFGQPCDGAAAAAVHCVSVTAASTVALHQRVFGTRAVHCQALDRCPGQKALPAQCVLQAAILKSTPQEPFPSVRCATLQVEVQAPWPT